MSAVFIDLSNNPSTQFCWPCLHPSIRALKFCIIPRSGLWKRRIPTWKVTWAELLRNCFIYWPSSCRRRLSRCTASRKVDTTWTRRLRSARSLRKFASGSCRLIHSRCGVCWIQFIVPSVRIARNWKDTSEEVFQHMTDALLASPALKKLLWIQSADHVTAASSKSY